MASIFANVQKFWEQDDFQCLQTAGKAVNDALRSDEENATADLYSRSQALGTHQYYYNNTGNNVSQQQQTLRHVKSVPLPALLQQQIRNANNSSFYMGLLAEPRLVYVAADAVLYLWCITDNSLCSFTVPSGQPIVSVGLAPPKKGKFSMCWLVFRIQLGVGC